MTTLYFEVHELCLIVDSIEDGAVESTLIEYVEQTFEIFGFVKVKS